MVNLLRQWRQWIRPLCVAFCVLITFVALPLMIVEFHQHNTSAVVQLWFIGGLFVLMALPISFWGILQHLINYTQPELQRLIIRILWMVPIYAINAWFAMKFPDAAIYLDTARECYEAYVIYNFLAYLLVFLRMEHENLEYELEQKIQITHLPPVCCLPPWRMGSELVQKCRHGVMQYTILRPITTVIAFICALVNKEKYGEGQFKFTSAWLYLMIVNNVSQVFAMYCLVLFYKATREELSPIRPISKFMCVKAVVFLSFWQSILISIVYAAIPAANPEDVDKRLQASQIQDFCICIEMFLAAIGHYFSFSYRPYVDPTATYNDCWQSFWLMWDVSDVQRDVAEHIRHVGNTASNVLTGPFRAGKAVPVQEGSEMTFLLANRGDDHGYTSTASDVSFDDSYRHQLLVVQDIERRNDRGTEPEIQVHANPEVASESEDFPSAVETRESRRQPLLGVRNNVIG